MSESESVEYKINKQIGTGAYGKVFLLRTGAGRSKKFALKVVDMSRLNQKEEECGNEGTLMLKLCHTHLVHCYDAFICSPHLYLVLELCCHGSFEQLLHERKTLFPEKQILAWMAQLADVLRYLHALKVIHRDLKPANIFLDENQSVKLGDLGVARELDNTKQERLSFVGTRPYMSPEVITGQPYNNKADIWSLGCCIHEVMTLKRTFQGQSWTELFHMVTSSKVPDMPSLYQSGLQSLVLSLLDADPSRRPDALEILFALFQMQAKKFSSDSSKPVDVPPFDHNQICQVVKSYEISSRSNTIQPLRPNSDSDPKRPTVVSKKKRSILKSLGNKRPADQVETLKADGIPIKSNDHDRLSPPLSSHPVSDHTPKSSHSAIQSEQALGSYDSQDEMSRTDGWTQEYMDTLARESIQWLRKRFKPKPTDSQFSESNSTDKTSDKSNKDDIDDSEDDNVDDDDVSCGLVTLFTQSQTAVYINNGKSTPHSPTHPDRTLTLTPKDKMMNLDLSESAVEAAKNTIQVFQGEDSSVLQLMLIKILGFRGYVLYSQHLLQTRE